MKKYLILAALVVILISSFVFTGCMETESPSPPVPPKDSYADEQNTAISELRKDVDDLKKQNPTDTYTKQQIDDKIANASSDSPYTKEELDKFFEDLWVEVGKKVDKSGSSSNDNSSSGDYGELVDSDGDLELWLEAIDPASDPFRMSSGVDEVLFDIVVVNLDDRSHKYDLAIRLTPEDATKIDCAGADVDVNPGDFDMLLSRSDCGSTTEIAVYIDNTDDIWIGGDEVEHYSIAIEFNTLASPTYWDYKLFIEDKS